MNNSSEKILVWDAPVRVFHWLMVLSFAGAYLTAESERWRLVHVSLGYTLGALVVFRIIWGLMGTRYARFTSFIRGPKAVAQYLRAMLNRKPEHHIGHNPAGAVAIALILLLSVAITATGWAIYNDVGGDLLTELHESFANIMLAIIGIHVIGVVITSWLHKENLVRSMVTGKKEGASNQAISRPWRPLAALLVAAVLTFWWLQWQSAPAAAKSAEVSSAGTAQYDLHNSDAD